MSIHNLARVFHPESVAVIGATERTGSVGAALMKNLTGWGYSGHVHPVNPGREEVFGHRAFPSVEKIGTGIDLAVIATPIVQVPGIIRECAACGVGGAVILSAGGKEAGAEGREREEEIRRAAEKQGLRVIGPNCLGIICTGEKLNASFASRTPLPGKIAFVSQSGALCTAILDMSLRERIGFRYFISVGSMMDVDVGDLIDYLGGDPEVSSIVMYLESLSHFRKFMSAARAVARIKPIVVLKAGRTRAGAGAAASHTGALAGDDAVYDAAFRRAGIVRVRTFEEMFDCAELLAKQPRPTGPGLAIITNAGGPGVMAADSLCDRGLEPVRLGAETVHRLNQVLPPHWSGANPIDILGDATPERYQKAVESCLLSDEVDGLLILLTPQNMTAPAEVAERLAKLLAGKAHPVIASWMGGADVAEGKDILNHAGIPTYDTPERAVRAFVDLYHNAVNQRLLQEIPPQLPHTLFFDRDRAGRILKQGLRRANPVLTEFESKQVLSAYGIPVNPTSVAHDQEEAVRLADGMGFPLVMKIHSQDILHKSEANGIRLDLRCVEDVREAFGRILADARAFRPDAEIQGVTLQPMLKSSGCELILGTKRDRDFGPVLLFGTGGIMTEILRDRALALPPLNRLLARRLMEETRVFQVLKGFRNQPPADLTALEEILIRLSQLASDFAEIEELDINPMIIADGRPCAVDARILLKPSALPAPRHLVISSYPNHLETTVVTEKGVKLFIRPIRPEDAPQLTTFFDSLSPQTVYFRFFHPLRSLPHSMLARFTQIDYDREMALLAFDAEAPREKILGVARVTRVPGREKAEFSIVLGDPWQGKGIGSALLRLCLSIAADQGTREVWGIALPENTHMLTLARKLGFQVRPIPGAREYEMSLELLQLKRFSGETEHGNSDLTT